MTKELRPKLRYGLEALPVQHSGEKMFVLRDRIGFSSESLVFSPAAIHILANMNGRNSLRDLQADFMKKSGQSIQTQDLQELVNTLDEHLFLDSDRFRRVAEKEISDFVGNPVRDMQHAGSSYPEDAEKLREKLRSFFSPQNGGPGYPAASGGRSGKVAGLVAPHIDLNAGGGCFAHAYKAAAQSLVPDTWIVLGTGHEPMENCFALTVKDFQTPLGTVKCDKKICEELLRRTPFDLLANQYNHRREHTIEFQAVFLSFLQPGARIVPLLCSFGEEEWSARGKMVDDFARLLAEIVFENNSHSAGLIASVDFAHVGPRYGDRFRPQPKAIEENLWQDTSLLKLLEQCRAQDFLDIINRDQNSRNICGVAPLYTMAKAFEGRAEGKTLSQSHAVVDDQGSFVTFASMAFYAETVGN
ncbi:MAG: AmmeMemoRadiSam system protein B [Syntrophobacteraceae bacterium]|nr:AmmeMemoRadiSam system protein B [Syntrophobacteraceae bacterium]